MPTFAKHLHKLPSCKTEGTEIIELYHRITEWPELKRTTMIIEFQPPRYVQGCQPPDQAAQSHIQPGLDCPSPSAAVCT